MSPDLIFPLCIVYGPITYWCQTPVLYTVLEAVRLKRTEIVFQMKTRERYFILCPLAKPCDLQRTYIRPTLTALP